MTEDMKEQIRKAQAEMATWSEDKRKSIRLEGTDLWLSNAPPDDGFATFTKAQWDSLKPTQGADGESLRPVAIYQVWDGDKLAWLDVQPDYYAERLPSNRRIVYATRDAAPSDTPTDEVEVFLSEVRAELIRARTKFPGDRIMGLALAEEYGELCKAMLDEPAANVRKEAVQTAVMCARVVLDGDGSVIEWRKERGLDPLIAASAPREMT